MASLRVGILGSNVEGSKRPTGALDETLDPELGLGQKAGASLVESNAPFIEGDRGLEGLAPGLELGDRALQLGESVVEAQTIDVRRGRPIPIARASSPRASVDHAAHPTP